MQFSGKGKALEIINDNKKIVKCLTLVVFFIQSNLFRAHLYFFSTPHDAYIDFFLHETCLSMFSFKCHTPLHTFLENPQNNIKN